MAAKNVTIRDGNYNGTNILDRQPPFNLDAEAGVLGSILLQATSLDDIGTNLDRRDFYDDANGRLFEVLSEMHDAGKKLDVLLVQAELKRRDLWEKVGGGGYISKLFQSVPNAAHAVYYALEVRKASLNRQVIDAATETLREAYDADVDGERLLETAETRLFAIGDRTMRTEPTTAADLVQAAMAELDARQSGKRQSGVATGFPDLDALIGGLRPAQLVILAGRPSMGKTACALNITENVILAGHPVLFVSLEMSNMELGDRLLSSQSGVSLHRMRAGTLSGEDRRHIQDAAAALAKTKLLTLDDATQSVRSIASAARRAARKQTLGLVVIDYLQLIEPSDERVPREQQVARIARKLKALAKDCQVPVLCLAQLNRQVEAGSDHRPRLSHLRESGAIEQDADVVMFVHREEYYRRGEEQEKVAGEAEVIVAKQRNGPTGDVQLVWQAKCTRFVTRAPDRNAQLDNYNEGN